MKLVTDTNPVTGHDDDLGPDTFPDFDFARLERYASGERYVNLIAIDVDETAWRTRVETIETALNWVFTQCELENLTACTLRHHAGQGTHVRNQQWRLPAPSAPKALEKLLDLAVLTDNFGFDSKTHVSAD